MSLGRATPTATWGDNAPLLEMTDVHIEFRVEGTWFPAVRGIDLSVASGETVAIVGESGSGKSAMAMSILGLLPDNGRISQGSIRFRGRELTDVNSETYRSLRGAEIGYVFQDPLSSLNPVLTVERQLTEQMRVHETLPRATARARGVELLERVGIADPRGSLSRYPFEFSGGMRQRISLAIALSCSPSLLIADEPTTALDVTVQAQVLDVLNDLQHDFGVGLIFITHDLAVAALVAQRIGVMYGGQIVEIGEREDITGSARHPYTRGLWEAMPTIDKPEIPLGIPGRPPGLGEFGQGCAFGTRCGHFVRGLCDARQHLDEVATSHTVRCTRWPELE